MGITIISLEAVTEIEKHLELENDLSKGSDYDQLYFNKVNALKQSLKPNPNDSEESDTDSSGSGDTEEDTIPEEGGDETSVDGDTESTPDEASGDTQATDSTDAPEETTESADTEVDAETVAKECFASLSSIRRLNHIQTKLLPGFALEDISELQFKKEMIDDLSYLSESTEKVSQIMREYIKGRFATYNQYLEKIMRAKQITSLNEKIKKVEASKDSDDVEQQVDENVAQAQTELEVGMDIDMKSTYKNELFVTQLKIGDSLEFDKNILVAKDFMQIALTNYSVSLKRSIEKIRNNIASSSDKAVGLVLPIPNFEGLDKIELEGYESPRGLCSYAYQDMLPGDMVFITYTAGTDSKSGLTPLEGCKSIFGVNTKQLATVRYSPLLDDRERLTAYLDALEEMIRFGKRALKYVYELCTDKMAELSRAFKEFKKVYDTRYIQTTVKDSQMLQLVTHADYVGRYTILTLMLLHDYMSRITEASLDYIRESLTEQDK